MNLFEDWPVQYGATAAAAPAAAPPAAAAAAAEATPARAGGAGGATAYETGNPHVPPHPTHGAATGLAAGGGGGQAKTKTKINDTHAVMLFRAWVVRSDGTTALVTSPTTL